jgi:HAD superfamily hydrolase (TIGR01509 family)
MTRYAVLFFDLDHTLVDTRRQYAEGLALTVERVYGPNGAPAGFIERFLHHHEALWPLYDNRQLTMQELRRERFLRAWKDFGVARTIAEADAFQAVYDSLFDETVRAFPGTAEMLRRLAPGRRFGIITNGSPDLQWRKLRAAGIDRFFDETAVIISERVGLAKPHPDVFAAACDALGVGSADALMIGDNWVADIGGARSFGMDALWYVPDAGMPLPDVAEIPVRDPLALPDAVFDLERRRSR